MPQNISEFRIIGRIGKTDIREKVAYVDVCANYNRQIDGEWQTDAHWNHVTCFGRSRDAAERAGKGDLVHITGRVRQEKYEREGAWHYTVELIAETISVLAKAADGGDDEGDGE